MAEINMVTLRDGYLVPEATVTTTIINLQAVKEENYIAFFDLVEKCKNAHYSLTRNPFTNSRAILKGYAFINAEEKVHDDISKIVLNAIEGEGFSLRIVNPLHHRQIVALQEKKEKKTCCSVLLHCWKKCMGD